MTQNIFNQMSKRKEEGKSNKNNNNSNKESDNKNISINDNEGVNNMDNKTKDIPVNKNSNKSVNKDNNKTDKKVAIKPARFVQNILKIEEEEKVLVGFRLEKSVAEAVDAIVDEHNLKKSQFVNDILKKSLGV